MNTVEEGVANFRDFQGTMKTFVDTFNQSEKDREKYEQERRAAIEAHNKRMDQRMNLVMAIVAVVGLLVTILVAMHGWEDAHGLSTRAQQVQTSQADMAHIPNLRQ